MDKSIDKTILDDGPVSGILYEDEETEKRHLRRYETSPQTLKEALEEDKNYFGEDKAKKNESCSHFNGARKKIMLRTGYSYQEARFLPEASNQGKIL